MPTLSVSEIKDYATKAGFSGADLDIAVAVAFAESGGNPTAHNSKPPDDSYGLWQINMLGAMGPARRKQFGITSNDQLYDPAINAKAAHSVFQSQGWNGWSTYKSGKYKNYMPAIGIDGEKVTQEDNGLSGIPGAITGFSKTVFKGVTNLAGISVAISFFVIGVVFLILSSNSTKKALSLAANVVPGGSVVKGAVKGAVKP
jgi:hypothetical protein